MGKNMLFVLSTAMVASVFFQTTASASDYKWSDNGDGTCTITSCTHLGGAVTIPSTLGGLTVTSIGRFGFMTNPMSTPDPMSFLNSSSPTSITIPDSIISIDDKAFMNCDSLVNVSVDPNNPAYQSLDGVLFNKELTKIIHYPSVKTGEYRIPESVAVVGRGAFSGCSKLPSVKMSNSVIKIGDGAFFGCTNLRDVKIGKSVTTIGDGVFENCSKMEEITVDAANSAYQSLDGVLFNKPLTKIIYYPRGRMGAYTIPDSVTTIGSNAFSRCKNLTKVIIPDNVIIIEESAFTECSNLASVTISDSVTSLGEMAFCETALTSIMIPDTVTTIGKGAFLSCDDLRDVRIGKSVTTIGDGVFENCSKIEEITVDAANSVYQSLEGVLFNKGLTKIIHYPSGKTGAYTIPDSVTVIGDKAFFQCTDLTSITIPDSVTVIGDMAFFQCTDLTDITIPDSVTVIGDMAFFQCTDLTGITIPDSVTIIGEKAFLDCSGLTSVAIPNSVTAIEKGLFAGCTGLTRVTISINATTIGDMAFGGCCGLKSVVIPESITNIETMAFFDCSGLRDIYFNGNPPVLGKGVFHGVNNATVYFLPNAVGWDAIYGGLPTAVLCKDTSDNESRVKIPLPSKYGGGTPPRYGRP